MPDPLPPQSGIVVAVHFFAPGGQGGVMSCTLDDGNGRQWPAQFRLWDTTAQVTWNAAPATPIDIAGNLAWWKANVIYWPLAELGGAALRADFTQL